MQRQDLFRKRRGGGGEAPKTTGKAKTGKAKTGQSKKGPGKPKAQQQLEKQPETTPPLDQDEV